MIEKLHDLRKDAGYIFSGFYDLSNEDVARLTGLEVADATKARQREASEPILWKDSADALEAFERHLNTVNLTLTKGGRFYHVMGLTDKAEAMQWLANKYRTTWQKQQWRTVALGDGPNDRPMLESADIAVVIPSESGETLTLSRVENLITAETPGPSGWQAAIECIMKSNQTRKGV
jgi:mannosyl-3-phosphoglycerate phosphatase